MSQFQKPANFDIFTIAIFEVVISSSWTQELELEKCPLGGPATVHMKLFSSNFTAIDTFENILLDNIELIWTLWSDHDEFRVLNKFRSLPQLVHDDEFFYRLEHGPTPSVHFYEFCSINILIEDPTIPVNEDNLRIYALYSRLTFYPFRSGGSHSITISFRFTCSLDFVDHFRFLPSQWFVHMIGCKFFEGGDQKLLSKFPNLYVCVVCNHSIQYAVYTNSIYNRNAYNFFRKLPNSLPLNMEIYKPGHVIELDTQPGFCANVRNTILSTKGIVSDPYACDLYDMLLQTLGKHLNIQRVYYPEKFITGQRKLLYSANKAIEKSLGWIVVGKHYVLVENFQSVLTPEIGYILGHFVVENYPSYVFYCDFKPFNRRYLIAFGAWLSPFAFTNWIALTICLFLISVTVTISKLNDSSVDFQIFLTDFINRWCLTVQILFRQDDYAASKLLLTFGFATFIYSSVYENKITSELIVPDKPHVMNDYIELLRAGYRLSFAVGKPDLNEFLSRRSYSDNSYSKILRNIERQFPDNELEDLVDFNLDDDGFYLEESLVNDRKRGGHELHLGAFDKRDLEPKLMKNKRNTTYKCQATKTPFAFYPNIFLTVSPLAEEIVKALHGYREAGLFIFWTKINAINRFFNNKYEQSVDGLNLEKTEEITIITLFNLIPLFAVSGVLIIISVAFHYIEVNYHWVVSKKNSKTI